VEHLIEAATEVGVAERVEDRVQRRVDVAESRDRRQDIISETRSAEGNDEETHEIRQETDGKLPHYPQLLGSLQHTRYRASHNIVNYSCNLGFVNSCQLFDYTAFITK
jgi:hypothetical protein